MVISYLRTLSAPGGAPVERGDAGRGEQIFWAKDRGNCGQCHMIGARGGRIGPNLSRIGAARSAAALEREIRRPAEVIPVGFETVTVVTKDGRRIRGARKNEDTFSVQIMTANEEIQSFSKKDVGPYGARTFADANLRAGAVEHRRFGRPRPVSAFAAWREGGAMRKRQLTGRLASASFAIVLGLGLVAHAQNVTNEHLLKGLADPGTWLNLRRQLHQPAAQPADADHARERQPAVGAVDVPDRHARQLRDDAARARRRLYVTGRKTSRGRSTRAPDARSGAIAASCRTT